MTENQRSPSPLPPPRPPRHPRCHLQGPIRTRQTKEPRWSTGPPVYTNEEHSITTWTFDCHVDYFRV